MPDMSPYDKVLLHISTSKKSAISAFPASGGRYPFPVDQLMQQVVIDRLLLAGEHLRSGDHLLFGAQYRSSIGRHYYAMYHAARAVVFAESGGDDFERHSILPRNLPISLPELTNWESGLTDARLLRNKADYDIYPLNDSDWESDARSLSVNSAKFLQVCESFATKNGYI